MADKIIQIKQKNGEDNDNLIPKRALTSDYPTGFTTRRSEEIEWGVQTGTLISCWDVDATESLGSIAFRKDCPRDGAVSMLIDGTVYVNEGLDEVAPLDDILYDNTTDVSSVSLEKSINIGDLLIIEYGFSLGGVKYRQQLSLRVMQFSSIDQSGNVTISRNFNRIFYFYSIYFYISSNTEIKVNAKTSAFEIAENPYDSITSNKESLSSFDVYIYKIYRRKY